MNVFNKHDVTLLITNAGCYVFHKYVYGGYTIHTMVLSSIVLITP